MKQLDKYQKRKETQEETWIMNTLKLLNMQRFGEEFSSTILSELYDNLRFYFLGSLH